MTYRSQEPIALPALPQHHRNCKHLSREREVSNSYITCLYKEELEKNNPSDSIKDNETIDIIQLYCPRHLP